MKLNGHWTERSQAVVLREAALREDLEKFASRVDSLERQISKKEEQINRQVETFAVFETGRSQSLHEEIAKREHAKQELQLCIQRRDALQREIDGLTLSPEQAAERRRGQDLFAELAAERVRIDQAISGKLAELRGLLLARSALTEKLSDAAGVIDLALYSTADFLDTDRFQSLWSLIPSGDFASVSALWLSRILGQEVPGVRKTYRVRRRILALRESLASHGVYREGDEISLSEQEAKEVLFGVPGRGHVEVETGGRGETGPVIVLK